MLDCETFTIEAYSGPRNDDPIAVHDRSDPLLRKLALGQHTAQGGDIQPRAQSVPDDPVTNEGHGHSDDRHVQHRADEQVGDHDHARVERLTDHLDIAARRTLRAERLRGADELPAGAVVQRDIPPARLGREHNDANMLSLGARIVGLEVALACVRAFLEGEFQGGRHARRVAKIRALERAGSDSAETARA